MALQNHTLKYNAKKANGQNLFAVDITKTAASFSLAKAAVAADVETQANAAQTGADELNEALASING